MMLANRKNDHSFGVTISLSAVIHLTVFLLIYYYGNFSSIMHKEETYYVDVVNLPVADPREGSPTQKGDSAPYTPPQTVENETAQSLPSKPAKQSIKSKNQKTEKNSAPDEFSEKIAKLKQKQEEQETEAAMKRISENLKSGGGSGRAGMPKGTGKESGSDYTAYIQSRLKDAFSKTISYTSRKPEVVVRLFIDSKGKIARKKTEKSSNDAAFEISVLRAIDIASANFPPPPNKKMFESVFVFRPDGIQPSR